MTAGQIFVSQALVPSHSKLHDPKERGDFWAKLMEAWGGVASKRAHHASFFPGSNPCSIGRSDLSKLSSSEYMVALKSDGVRYLLFLTIRPGTREDPVALMIDRARNMYEVDLMAPEEFFLRGTILEGELVWRQPEQREMVFLVFDAIRVAGEGLTDKPFRERLGRAAQCTRFSEELTAVSPEDLEARIDETGSLALIHYEPRVRMKLKRFVDIAHSMRVWSDRNEAEHRVDGLILQRSDACYVCGTAGDAIFKWKDHSSVDLIGKVPRAADGPLPTTMFGRRLEIPSSRIEASHDGDVVEYHIDVQSDKIVFFAMRARPDKTTANGLRVVQSTVQDVIEGLQPDDLVRHSSSNSKAIA